MKKDRNRHFLYRLIGSVQQVHQSTTPVRQNQADITVFKFVHSHFDLSQSRSPQQMVIYTLIRPSNKGPSNRYPPDLPEPEIGTEHRCPKAEDFGAPYGIQTRFPYAEYERKLPSKSNRNPFSPIRHPSQYNKSGIRQQSENMLVDRYDNGIGRMVL